MALGMFQASPDGQARVLGLPLSFDGQRPPFVRDAPLFGEHTAETFPRSCRRLTPSLTAMPGRRRQLRAQSPYRSGQALSAYRNSWRGGVDELSLLHASRSLALALAANILLSFLVAAEYPERAHQDDRALRGRRLLRHHWPRCRGVLGEGTGTANRHRERRRGGRRGWYAARRSARILTGYTLLLGANSELLVNKALQPNLSYEVGIRDLVPIGLVATGANVILGKIDLPAKTWPELMALAASMPNGIKF